MLRRLLFLFLATSLIFPVVASAEDPYQEEAIYAAPGFNPQRPYFNQTAREHVDPYTGNVLLTYTDIYLPGDGGLDLKVQRTYNSKIHKEKNGYDVSEADLIECDYAGIGWSLHMGKVYPLRLPQRPIPKVVMPDGSVHPAFSTTQGSVRQTKDLWEYEEIFQGGVWYAYLTLNDGTVYRFRTSGFWKDETGRDVTSTDSWYPLEAITDVHGNQIVVTSVVKKTHFVIDKISMSSGSRTVQFSYLYSGLASHPYQITIVAPAGSGSATSTYTYNFSVTTGVLPEISRLTSVSLPAGLRWQYQYSDSDTATHKKYELMNVTYPTGGIISYEYATLVLNQPVVKNPCPSRVVTKRTTSGRDITGGIWTFGYNRGNSIYDYTTMNGPNSLKEEYTFYGPRFCDSGHNYLIGSLLTKKVYEGSTILQQEDYAWAQKKKISDDNYSYSNLTGTDYETWFPVLTTKTVTRDGTAYSTTYSSFYQDYLPQTISETGQDTRTTTRTYWDNPSLHILGLVDDETITGAGTFHTTRSYLNTGKPEYVEKYGIRTNYTYLSNGNLSREQDELARGTTYDNYAYGQPRTIITGQYTYTQTINAAGTLASVTRTTKTTTGNTSHTIRYTYDGLNRPTKVDTPLESDVVLTYATDGSTKKVTKGTYWIQYTYDGFGRLSFVQNSAGVKRDINYNALGNPSYQSYPYSSTKIGDTLVCDTLGRLKKATHPDSKYVSYTYQPGNRVDVRNERALTTYNYHDSFGDPDEKRLVQVVDANSETTQYEYNALGSLTRVNQPLIPDRVFTYGTPEGENLLREEFHPENGTTSYQYYTNGLLKAKTDARGNAVYYAYDANNRLTTIDYPNSQYDVTFEYDNSDNRGRMSMSGNVYDYFYNTEDRLAEVRFSYKSKTYTTRYTYDGRGNLTNLQYPSGRNVAYVYDAGNRVQSVTGFATSIIYHPSGAMQIVTLANGISNSYTYNNRYWVSSIKAGSFIDLSYSIYDEVGNLLWLIDNLDANRSKYMTHTKLDQLYTAESGLFGGTFTFGYDAVGNRTSMNSTSYSYNYNTNRLTSYTGSPTLTYDANGNFTKSGAYAYDPANRFTSGDGETYTYNGDGQRIEKASGTDVTVYHYDKAGNVIVETDAAGTVKAEYVYANGVHVAKIQK